MACDLSKANAPHQLAEQISELGLDNLQRKKYFAKQISRHAWADYLEEADHLRRTEQNKRIYSQCMA